MRDIVCDHCGGTDFYKEAGFFYCNGCQIQSQEVQEYLFDEHEGEQNKYVSKKLQTGKSDKTDNKITSWECYNYILLGLTEELIKLGAHKSLKPVVRTLWLRYLEKMQVFKRGKDDLPKLQAVNFRTDAEIVYGKARKKRRRCRSSSDESISHDSSSLKRERTRKRRALVQAQYEDFTQKSQATTSLHNETLTSLQSESEKSSKNACAVTYNIYASKELRRKQSYYHLRKHRLDFDQNLNCHTFSYRKISHKYRASPFILSLNKLYSILYLGLLIIKDPIQLADILRFIKEGHLSFNEYSHFFPEDFSDKVLNFRNFKKNSVFANSAFRTITSDMAMFLEIDWYIARPDLVGLCERYCKELNLPNEVCDCAKNIISRTSMRMSFRKRTTSKVPNYEGRVLSVILFVIKLLFGLDDVTEFQLANYSDILNQSEAVNPKMFNVVNWLKYIEYRGLVLAQHHFPTNFNNNHNIKNVSLAVSFLSKRELPEPKFNTKKDNFKTLLTKLKDHGIVPQTTEFPVTLTPLLDYTKLLPKSRYLKILSEDYTNDSLIYLLRPSKFLNIANKGEDPQIVNGGANDDWNMEKLRCAERDKKRVLRDKRKFITVKLTLKNEIRAETSSNKTEIDSDIIKENFHAANEKCFRKNLRRVNKHQGNLMDFDFDKIRRDLRDSPKTYPVHYNPHERYWMRTQINIEALSRKKCIEFLDKFPSNFRLILKECQRIAQQTEQEFLIEYQLTELYLAYLADYKVEMKQNPVSDSLLANYLTKCVSQW